MRKKPRKGYEAYLLVKAGTHSHAEAARECGIYPATVSYECRKHGLRGITERGRSATARARSIASRKAAVEYRARIGVDPLKIYEMASAGQTYLKVALALGLTRNQVAGYVSRVKSGVQYGAQAGE